MTPTMMRIIKIPDCSGRVCSAQHLRSTFLVPLAFFILTMTACSDQRVESSSRPQPSPITNNAAAPAPALTTDDSLSVTGPLIVEHQVDITALREGIIATISADAGDRVKSGAVLAKLDDRQLLSNLEAARAKTRSIEADLKNWEAEAEVLKADLVRAQRLWNEKLIAEEQLQHAQYKLESDKWDILR